MLPYLIELPSELIRPTPNPNNPNFTISTAPTRVTEFTTTPEAKADRGDKKI